MTYDAARGGRGGGWTPTCNNGFLGEVRWYIRETETVEAAAQKFQASGGSGMNEPG
jgi:hypothetical protein